jgi:adenylate cyclase
MVSIFKKNVAPENQRFFVITQVAYIVGAVLHTLGCIGFRSDQIYEMFWFNVIISVPTFIIAFFINRKGRHNLAFSIAFAELLLHQALGVYYLGWDSGFQYWLIYLIGLCFFNAQWGTLVRLFCFTTVMATYIVLYLFFRASPVYTLTASEYTSSYLASAFLALLLLGLLINYYVQAGNKAEKNLKSTNLHLEEMTTLLKKMFGRYLSPEVMNSIIKDPSTLELGGEERQVTIMMTDLRGFTALCEQLTPDQVVQMLNSYFEIILGIIEKYHGTINEIIGDALLVIFGAPLDMEDRSHKAIACAIEMQNAMTEVNRKNRSKGLPELEMGIGLNATEVIVGNVGSSHRSKYAVVGSGVNLTSRIESYTVGGQILVSESVYQEAGQQLRIDSQRDVLPKGAKTPLKIYEVGGIAGEYNLALESHDTQRLELRQPIPIKYDTVQKKDTTDRSIRGFIRTLSTCDAEITMNDEIDLYMDLKIQLVDVDEKLSSKSFYCKVVHRVVEHGNNYLVRFTMLPPEVDSYFQALRQHATKS